MIRYALTITEFEILVNLANAPKSAGQLAKAIQVDADGIYVYMCRMAKKGLAVRDGRGWGATYSPTSKGKKILNAVRAKIL